MRKPARVVFALHADPLFLEQLGRATRDAYRLYPISDWGELFERIGSAPASALVVVDPYEGQERGAGVAPDLKALMNQYPSLAVVAAMHLTPGRLEDVLELGGLGVSQVISLSEERTAVGIRHRLESARGRPLRVLIGRMLPPTLTGPGRSILSMAVSIGTDGGNAAELARSLHVTQRTLLRWCRRAGLPAPRTLLAWVRMMLAAELLDDPGRTVLDVAYACGYASDSSLRHAMMSFLHVPPGELRRRGAFETSSHGFLQTLVEARDEKRRYRAAARAG